MSKGDDLKKIADRFWNETARIEKTILLAGSLADESMPDALEEFLRDEDIKILESVFGPLPGYLKDELENEEIGGVGEWLYSSGKLGFLLQIVTPVMTPTGKNSVSYSWGHLTWRWVYGDTLNAALKAGFAFVKEQRKKEKARVQLR